MIMATQKTLTFALTATLLFASGCSGSRLKNLIGRNDYATLEELEREDDAYADLYDEIDETDSRFVSQSREVDEPVDPTEEPKSRFSLSRLLGRDKTETDFADMEDPFATSLEDEQAVRNLRDEIQRLKKQVADKSRSVVDQVEEEVHEDPLIGTDRYVASLDQVEEQAEAMFDELSRASDSRVDDSEANPFAQASSSQEAPPFADEVSSKSFSDFLDRQEEPAFADTNNPFATPDEPVVTPTADTADGLNFDSLVSESTRESAFEDAVSRQEDLFPEANDVFADALGISSGSESEVVADVNPFEADQAPPIPAVSTDDYASASEKHGFGALKTQDPWAAFGKDDEQAVPVVSTESRAGFEWGTPSENATEFSSDPPVPGTPVDVVQVSSAADSLFSMATQTDEAPLTIPAQIPVAEAALELPVTEASDVELVDPFRDESAFADLEQIPATEFPSEESETASTTGGPATITSAPGRLWFFVLGCIALAALLFMPSRQTQKN